MLLFRVPLHRHEKSAPGTGSPKIESSKTICWASGSPVLLARLGQCKFSNFWCWRQNFTALGVNTMPADALAPKVARGSASMILAV